MSISTEYSKYLLVPSVVKAHFAWTWQCSTLNRSDELVSLPMACIQPYALKLPEYQLKNGSVSPVFQMVEGVLAMFYETKTARPGVILIFSFTFNSMLTLKF
jgi:hypothetical protein